MTTLPEKKQAILTLIRETEQELVYGDGREGCERCIEALNQELLIVICHELLGYER